MSEIHAFLGISKATVFAYRSGKQPISDKAWRKLEAAEARAGLGLPAARNAESSGKVKESAPPDLYKTLFYKVAHESDLNWLLDRVDELLRGAASGDTEAAKAALLLMPILRTRCDALLPSPPHHPL